MKIYSKENVSLSKLLINLGCYIASIAVAIYFLRTLYVLKVDVPSVLLAAGIFIFYFYLYTHKVFISSGRLLIVSLLFYFAWWTATETIPISDFLQFYYEAVGFSKSPNLTIWANSKNPFSSAYYGLFIYIFGETYFSAIIGAFVMWATQAIILKKILLEIGADDSLAGTLSFAYATAPSIVGFSTVISSEAVFISLLLAAVLFGIKSLKYGRIFDSVLLGLFFGFAHLTRGNAALYLWPIFLLMAINPYALGRINKYLTIFPAIGCLGLILIFQLFVNYSYHNRLSISPNNMVVYLFLSGTNFKFHGGWNPDDVQLAGYDKAISPSEFSAANEKARKIALERILENPTEFFRFSITEKLNRFWPKKNEMIFWASTNEKLNPPSYLIHSLHKLYFSWLVLLLSLCILSATSFVYFVSIFQEKNVPSLTTGLILGSGGILTNAGAHLLIEVQGRYHLPFYPFVIIFICTALLYFERILRERSAAESSHEIRDHADQP